MAELAPLYFSHHRAHEGLVACIELLKARRKEADVRREEVVREETDVHANARDALDHANEKIVDLYRCI